MGEGVFKIYENLFAAVVSIDEDGVVLVGTTSEKCIGGVSEFPCDALRRDAFGISWQRADIYRCDSDVRTSAG